MSAQSEHILPALIVLFIKSLVTDDVTLFILEGHPNLFFGIFIFSLVNIPTGELPVSIVGNFREFDAGNQISQNVGFPIPGIMATVIDFDASVNLIPFSSQQNVVVHNDGIRMEYSFFIHPATIVFPIDFIAFRMIFFLNRIPISTTEIVIIF